MQKVIGVNLNGNAYQVDEGGYDTLRQYLARAAQQLGANPDRDEIMADLEQAIADKCQRYLGPHKGVVAAEEIDRIVAEMGPVEAEGGEKPTAPDGEAGAPGKGAQVPDAPPRRLYRIPAGAMIAGICTGLAAFLKIDVTLVRIGFVAAALLTRGGAAIAYVVLMFVIPEAGTPEEHAAASGMPFNAKEVIGRAARRSADTGRQWRRHWRDYRRTWRRHGWPAWAPGAYVPPPAAAVLLPLFELLHVGLFLIALAALISLVNTGAILSWELPADVPVWAAALILLVAYQIIVSPFRIARYWVWHPAGPDGPAPFAFWTAVVWLIGLAFAIWLASDHIPEIREFLQHLPDLFREFGLAVRDLVSRVRAR